MTGSSPCLPAGRLSRQGIGCLQLVLDTGQREDWFSSSFIVWFSLISISSLILFIAVEFIPDLLPGHGSLGAIYNELLRQASMLAFNDCFYLLSVMMIFILPLVLLMKKAKESASPTGVH